MLLYKTIYNVVHIEWFLSSYMVLLPPHSPFLYPNEDFFTPTWWWKMYETHFSSTATQSTQTIMRFSQRPMVHSRVSPLMFKHLISDEIMYHIQMGWHQFFCCAQSVTRSGHSTVLDTDTQFIHFCLICTGTFACWYLKDVTCDTDDWSNEAKKSA